MSTSGDIGETAQRRWSQRGQDIAAILWPSFLAGALASVLCFAFVDPTGLELQHGARAIGRMTGYALGFFFFWFIGAVSSLITLYLVRTAHTDS